MKHDIAFEVLAAVEYGTFTTGELIHRTGRSPTTVIRYLGELEERGWVEREPAARFGAGRPPVVSRPTEAGRAILHQAETAWFRKISSGGARVLWGPTRAMAFWGVSFSGPPDVFTDHAIDTGLFARVVVPKDALYEDPVARGDGLYPSLESLLAWAAQSGDPRLAAAAAVLVSHPQLNVALLTDRSAGLRCPNRVGFLASLAGRDIGFRPALRTERMLRFESPVEPATAVLARRWHVERPISAAAVRDLEALYGRPA